MDEDLTAEQLKVLEMVSQERYTVYDLYKKRHISLGTASPALDTLRKRGLVQEKSGSRGAKIHSLTPAGSAVLVKLQRLTERTREIIRDTLPKVKVKKGVKRISITYPELAHQLNSSRGVAKFCAGKVLNTNVNGIAIVLKEGPIELIIKDDPIEDQGDTTFLPVPEEDTSGEGNMYGALPFGPTRTQVYGHIFSTHEKTRKGTDEKEKEEHKRDIFDALPFGPSSSKESQPHIPNKPSIGFLDDFARYANTHRKDSISFLNDFVSTVSTPTSKDGTPHEVLPWCSPPYQKTHRRDFAAEFLDRISS